MYSHYSSVAGLPSSMSMALDSAFDAVEESFWDDDDPVQRPPVPGQREQVLDTDYDPDPAQQATPLKNTQGKKPVARTKKPAKKR
ncbi:MAG: hypothetical protein V4709_04885 [Pseudomonadota bacterium]